MSRVETALTIGGAAPSSNLSHTNCTELVQIRLSPGEHGWHIHDFGDLAAGSYGQYTGGHFIGTVPAERQEVGLIGDGAKIVADAGGFSFGSINDKYMELEGKNSILGRSIVIHGTATNSSARVAMCVIGRSSLTPPETPCKEGGSGDSTGDSGNSTNTPTPSKN